MALDSAGLIGRDIGNVTILEELGKGAMGGVYVGFQKSLKRRVAVKILPRDLSEKHLGKLRFRDEAETVAVLSHPHIVPIFDMGETDEFLFQIMQLVEGEDLRTKLKRHSLHPAPSHRLIGTEKSVMYMLPILNALSCAHEACVIHQDVKPANILIEERSGRPLLADFGIAKAEGTLAPRSDVVMGTPLYMAPEQISGEPTGPACDIYSAGLVLFELLAGALPVAKNSVEGLVQTKVNDPDKLFTRTPSECGIDADLERIILTAAAPRQSSRYQSCRTFERDLAAYAKKHGLAV